MKIVRDKSKVTEMIIEIENELDKVKDHIENGRDVMVAFTLDWLTLDRSGIGQHSGGVDTREQRD